METLTVPAINLAAIAPFAVVVVTAMIVILAGLLVHDDDDVVLPGLSIVGLVVAFAFALGFWGQRATAFAGMVAVDPLAGFFSVLILIAAIVTVILSTGQMREQRSITAGEYYSLLLFSTAGMLLLAQAADLVIVVIGIELLSLGLYVLAGYVRARQSSLEAAMKYFLLGAFALGFVIYGSALVFGVTGTTKFAGIASALAGTGQAAAASNTFFLVGVGLLLVGIAFKLSVVPFHQWTPDVYEGAPTAITAFMSVATKAAVFGVLLRFLSDAVPQLRPDWQAILWGLALLTMIVGNVAALAQISVKRMLAYSSIAQAGYILIPIIAGDQLGAASVMFYLLAYTFMNLGAFAVLLALGRTVDDDPQLGHLNGLSQRAPLAAAAMTIFMLSLAGIPPTAGFMAKLYAFSAGVRAGYVDLVLVGVITSAIATFYYLRVVVNMYMRSPELLEALPGERISVTTGDTSVVAAAAVARPLPVAGALGALMIALVGATILLGVVPALPLEIAQAAIPTGR